MVNWEKKWFLGARMKLRKKIRIFWLKFKFRLKFIQVRHQKLTPGNYKKKLHNEKRKVMKIRKKIVNPLAVIFINTHKSENTS